jgi:hypothetical protein
MSVSTTVPECLVVRHYEVVEKEYKFPKVDPVTKKPLVNSKGNQIFGKRTIRILFFRDQSPIKGSGYFRVGIGKRGDFVVSELPLPKSGRLVEIKRRSPLNFSTESEASFKEVERFTTLLPFANFLKARIGEEAAAKAIIEFVI